MPAYTPDFYADIGIPSDAEQRTRGILDSAKGYVVPQDQPLVDYYRSVNKPEAAPVQARPSGPMDFIRQQQYQQAQQQAAAAQVATQTIQDLSKLDPGDPDHLAHQEALLAANPLGPNILKDPRVIGVVKSLARRHGELQKFFDKDPQAIYDYTTLKQQGVPSEQAHEQVRRNVATRANRSSFVKMGGELEDFDKFVDPKSGAFDEAAAISHIREGEGARLSKPPDSWIKKVDALAKRYQDESSNDLNSEDEINNKKEYAKQHNIKLDEAGWKKAYEGLKQERLAEVQKQLHAELLDAETNNYLPNNQLRQLVGLPPIPTKIKKDKVIIDRAKMNQPAEQPAAPQASSSATLPPGVKVTIIK